MLGADNVDLAGEGLQLPMFGAAVQAHVTLRDAEGLLQGSGMAHDLAEQTQHFNALVLRNPHAEIRALEMLVCLGQQTLQLFDLALMILAVEQCRIDTGLTQEQVGSVSGFDAKPAYRRTAYNIPDSHGVSCERYWPSCRFGGVSQKVKFCSGLLPSLALLITTIEGVAMFDVVINNGRLFDGTGAPSRVCNLAIRDGVVADISEQPLDEAGARVIDAGGCWVTPGFIDTHTHYDVELIVAPSLSESVRHGVTTALIGSCSLSMVCSDAEDASDIFTRVETVPREKVLPILQRHKTWRTPSEWVGFIERQPLGPNIISFLGHSDLRVAVMGLHRSTDRAVRPTEAELLQMESLLEEALDEGFLGLSSMCLKWDKIDGDREWSKSLPSTYARWSEVKRLNEHLRRRGRVHQGAPNAANPLQIFQYLGEALGVLRKPLKTTLISMLDLKGNKTVAPMAKLAARVTNLLGGDFRWQVLPTPFAIYADGIDHVVFEEFGAGEMARNLKTEVEQNALFKDEAYRRKFRRFYSEKFSPRVWQRDFGDAIILDCPEKRYVGRDFADIANEKGMHVVDLFLDLMVEYGRKLRWFTIIGNHRVDRLRAMVSNPDTLITFSDAGAHIRNMAFYNLPLRFLQLIKQSIDEGNPAMSLERAVHRLTGEQAQWMGIDAGTLRVGDRADVVVLDPSQLGQPLDIETWAEMEGFGLERMVNRNAGIVRNVLINGKVAVEEGEPVAELGKVQGFGRYLRAR